jgi:hypothetical protein
VNGKLIAGFLVLTGVIAGGVMYWLQVYAYYEPVTFVPGAEIVLTPIIGDGPEAIVADAVTGIDAKSSPLRFRACFTTPTSLATLTETYRVYENAVPLITPGWFDCFDPEKIGAALESGTAVAFLGQANVAKGVDSVVAILPDGHGYVWHQLRTDIEE